jgi:uncharacterized membrane protein YsdA (DUF1294 family)
MPASIRCDARLRNGYLRPPMGWNEMLPTLRAVLIAYGVMSVVTFLAFGLDKSAARGGRRRVPERTLHLLALLGGWPGTLLAMPVFRHKRRKISFVAVVILIALLHAAGWVWLLGGR